MALSLGLRAKQAPVCREARMPTAGALASLLQNRQSHAGEISWEHVDIERATQILDERLD